MSLAEDKSIKEVETQELAGQEQRFGGYRGGYGGRRYVRKTAIEHYINNQNRL